jgi:DNA repair protein RecO (recombination protein O)
LPSKEIIQDEVICLTRREFSETSLVLVFMSREHGKVSVLAKGVKRPRGKTAGGIDLLDCGQASILLNHEGLSLLREFLPGTPYPAIRNDLRKWYVALYLAEVVSLTSQELEPAPAVFNLFTRAVERVAEVEASEDLAKVLVRGLQRLIVLIGYKPELESCVICKRRMTQRDWLFFSAANGGLICRDCEPGVVDKIRLDHQTWYYLLNKVHDLVSAGQAFEVLNQLLREHLDRIPALTSYCRRIFDSDGR